METNGEIVSAWDRVKGHSLQKKVLERSIAHHKIHHAMLFSGLGGVGKTTLAKAFATALNCGERPKDAWKPACGHCESCIKMAKEIHPDFQYVTPNGKFIRVEQIREVIRYCRTGPFESFYKIVLIDAADAMNRESANALLKTLEEPVQQVLLLMVTDRPDALLDTILSRCQHLRFGSLEEKEIWGIVTDYFATKTGSSENNEGGYTREAIEVAARLGAGSPGRAIEILNHAVFEERKELFKMVMALRHDSTAAQNRLAESFARAGRTDLEMKLDLLRSFFRDLSIYAATKSKKRLIHRDSFHLIEKSTLHMTSLVAAECAEHVNRSLMMLEYNVQPQMVVDGLLQFIGSHNKV